MKLPLMLRSTHEAELDKAINIITEKNRAIAVKKRWTSSWKENQCRNSRKSQ